MTDGIRFIEGFEGDSLSLVWESVPSDSSPFSNPVGRNLAFGRDSGYGMGVNGLDQIRMESPLWIPTPMVIAGFAFRCSNFGAWAGSIPIIEFRTPNDQTLVQLGIDGQTLLRVATGNTPGEVTTRAFAQIGLDNAAFYYIEIAVWMHPSAGRVVVQLNGPPGTPGLSPATIIDTGFSVPTGDPDDYFGGFNQFHMGCLGGFSNEARHFSFDDIYVRDGEIGPTFLGDTSVHLISLEDDRAIQFIRLSGAKNYLMVNEVTPDEDTSYNQTPDEVFDAEDVFEVADQTFEGVIHCLQLVARARKTQTHVWTLETLIDLAGVKAYGAPRFLGFPGYETFPPDVYWTAPGGLDWTLARLNAIGVGYRAESPQPGS